MNQPQIAYLLKKFPRLSETFVLNEILRLEQRGVGIRVIGRREPDDEPRHPQISALRASVELVPRSGIDPFQELFADPASKSLPLERFGEVVRSVQPYRHDRMPKLFTEALWLRRRLSELNIQHVHVHFATDSAIVAMLVHALGGPTYSLTAHAKDIYRSAVDPGLLSRIVESSAFTVTVCDANVAHLESVLTPAAARQVRRLYNGIDLECFAPPEVEREPDHLLAVGRLVAKKGFHCWIDALAKLRESGRVFRATLVGTGDDEQALRAQAAAAGLDSCLEFTGARDQEFVADLMRRATLFCLPCIVAEDGNRDALPTVLLEALACGLPVVSTTVTGIPEILDGGKAGRLLAPGDVDGLAAAMGELLERPQERAEYAKQGLVHVANHFDAGVQAKSLAEWFDACLQAPVG